QIPVRVERARGEDGSDPVHADSGSSALPASRRDELSLRLNRRAVAPNAVASCCRDSDLIRTASRDRTYSLWKRLIDAENGAAISRPNTTWPRRVNARPVKKAAAYSEGEVANASRHMSHAHSSCATSSIVRQRAKTLRASGYHTLRCNVSE